MFYALNIKVGDKVELGAATFVASHVVAEEPDAPFNVFSSSQRILINQAILQKLRLFSRVVVFFTASCMLGTKAISKIFIAG